MYWPVYILMAPLGYSVEMFVSQMLINKFYGFWLHTRTIGKLPLVEGILSTPSAHRVHHGMNDVYIDKNHGGIFILFDRAFGTYAEEKEEVIYGVRKRHTSYDPVWAHFDWLSPLWQDARRTASWWDKLRIWFMPTGWRPKDVEQAFPRPEVSLASYVKFDGERGQYPVLLPLALFGVLAAASQMLTMGSSSWSWLAKSGLAIAITLGLIALGHVLNESKRKSDG
ncbi:MAG: sterol desaturase family protein [Deltaproteobacteria bacterium]